VAHILLFRRPMAMPTSEVVAVENSDDVVCDVLTAAPAGDTNHLLCRSHDEPLSDFGRRVESRLQALRKRSSLQKVSYVLGSRSPRDWLDCRPALAALIGLLSSGAEFELVASPSFDVDVVRTLEELMPFANVGVRVSIRQERATTTLGGNAQLSDRAERRLSSHDVSPLPRVIGIPSRASNARDAQYVA
jgi:hypothetical protein